MGPGLLRKKNVIGCTRESCNVLELIRVLQWCPCCLNGVRSLRTKSKLLHLAQQAFRNLGFFPQLLLP